MDIFSTQNKKKITKKMKNNEIMKKITRWGSDRPGWSTVSKMSIPLAYADHHY